MLGRPALAIVGSRNATPQGAQNAETFARALSDAGLLIVSGMASGIDAAAHRGGLSGRSGSVAVVGTGLDIIYPPTNRDLALALARDGALISEFPLGTEPLAGNFPRRNRLISGLARGVLVVEATMNSGSLITARFAGEQGRELFAVPGSIHSPFSKGCHRLIRQGAKLVETVGDILEELQWSSLEQASERLPGVAGAGDDPLLKAIGYDPVSVDTIAARSGLPVDKVIGRLLLLELDGTIVALPGGLYQRSG